MDSSQEFLLSRRKFLEFLGRTGVTVSAGLSLFPLMPAFAQASKQGVIEKNSSLLRGIAPSSLDQVVLAEGLNYEILITYNDPLNAQGLRFGFNNDYLAMLPLFNAEGKPIPGEGLLWVNHESPHRLFVGGYVLGKERTRDQIVREQEATGGSILRIRKSKSGRWSFVSGAAENRRITAQTPIPLVYAGESKSTVGMVGNCAGGVTPWNTILTCEENFNEFYGDVSFKGKGKKQKRKVTYLPQIESYEWHKYFDYPPEDYGWVVEVDPLTGSAKKLMALGRFCHESATTRLAPDGRCVVYTGDDTENEFLYKFIADRPGSLESGTLYVANTKKGRWLPLDIRQNKKLAKAFSDQRELLIRTREAARIVHATHLDRPEDIEIDPLTGAVFVSLTNNKEKGNFFGSILKIKEKDDDPRSLEFEASTFLTGGAETGFACPDNMVFDSKGNLWFASDISGTAMGKPPYASFKNNGIFVVPVSGAQAGKAIQIASAPVDAEFTGISFSLDRKTLFASVQHPGETSASLNALTSHWPGGGSSIPKPAVIQIYGEVLQELL